MTFGAQISRVRANRKIGGKRLARTMSIFRHCTLWRRRMRGEALRKHLFGKITMGAEQVKKTDLYVLSQTCPTVQVLAISERRGKIRIPPRAAFAKVSAGFKTGREYSGCPSVWAKY